MECTWGERADLQKLQTDAAQFPNVEIGGQGKAGQAWVTVGGKGTNTGSLSSLQCPETTKVKLITNVDGTESFILGESGQKQEEAKQRTRDQERRKEQEAR